MKTALQGIALVLSLAFSLLAVVAADFQVRTPGGIFAFQINALHVPTLTSIRGHTYTFDVETSNNHPFHIESDGVDNNINSGLLTFTVPTNTAVRYYECVVHGAQMRGEIITVPAPRIEILNLSIVSTNLVLTSTTTNNWNIYPEYKSNLGDTNWFALTVQSNRFVNGTRETFCGRPPGDSVLIRIRATP